MKQTTYGDRHQESLSIGHARPTSARLAGAFRPPRTGLTQTRAGKSWFVDTCNSDALRRKLYLCLSISEGTSFVKRVMTVHIISLKNMFFLQIVECITITHY